jgi:RNA polymerase sigma-70 factor, ECF subfamily
MPTANDRPRPDSTRTGRLLDRAAAGDASAVGELLVYNRPHLLEFVEFHLAPTVRGRLDPSDVVQDAQAEIARRLNDFLSRRPMPFHLWARKTTYERLLDLHRKHIHRSRRAVGRERLLPDRSSLALARPFLAAGPSPSQEAADREFTDRVARAIEQLPEADREVLLLRHADGLPFAEIGSLLDLDPAAARKRFGRALIRLQKVLAEAGLLGDES